MTKAPPIFGSLPTSSQTGRLSGADHFARAMVSHLIAVSQPLYKGDALSVARQRYGDNLATLEIVKAISNPAATDVEDWAALWAASDALVDFTSAMPSVLAQISRRTRFGNIDLRERWSIPGPVEAPAASWIAEGAPIEVIMGKIGPVVRLDPKKVSVIVTAHRELLESRAAERMLRVSLGESVALALDEAFLSADAPTALKPGGVFYGLTPITASTAASPADAMLEDVSALVDALDAHVDPNSIMFVMGKAQGIALKMCYPQFYGILASPRVPPGTILCLDSSSLVTGIGGPVLDLSQNSALHMSDIPAELVSGAGAVAAPQRSLWQTATSAMRLQMDANWGMRGSNRASFVEDVKW